MSEPKNEEKPSLKLQDLENFIQRMATIKSELEYEKTNYLKKIDEALLRFVKGDGFNIEVFNNKIKELQDIATSIASKRNFLYKHRYTMQAIRTLAQSDLDYNDRSSFL